MKKRLGLSRFATWVVVECGGLREGVLWTGCSRWGLEICASLYSISMMSTSRFGVAVVDMDVWGGGGKGQGKEFTDYLSD